MSKLLAEKHCTSLQTQLYVQCGRLGLQCRAGFQRPQTKQREIIVGCTGWFQRLVSMICSLCISSFNMWAPFRDFDQFVLRLLLLSLSQAGRFFGTFKEPYTFLVCIPLYV
jgi:hypothetical protein